MKLAILPVVLSSVILFACGSGSPPTTSTPSTNSSTDYQIGWEQYRQLAENCRVETIYTTHSGVLRITTTDGQAHDVSLTDLDREYRKGFDYNLWFEDVEEKCGQINRITE